MVSERRNEEGPEAAVIPELIGHSVLHGQAFAQRKRLERPLTAETDVGQPGLAGDLHPGHQMRQRPLRRADPGQDECDLEPQLAHRRGEEGVLLEAISARGSAQELFLDRFQVRANDSVPLNGQIVEGKSAEVGDVQVAEGFRGWRKRRQGTDSLKIVAKPHRPIVAAAGAECERLPAMARGWESKSVESQMAEERHSGQHPARTRDEIELQRKRESLEMSRRSVVGDLEGARNPTHRAALENALRFLDEELGKLSAGS